MDLESYAAMRAKGMTKLAGPFRAIWRLLKSKQVASATPADSGADFGLEKFKKNRKKKTAKNKGGSYIRTKIRET